MGWLFGKQKYWVVLLAAAFLVIQTSGADAEDPASLPTGWQQMTPSDFAAAVGQLFASDKFRLLSTEEQNAAKDRGEELFLQIDVLKTTLSYETLEVLHHLARYLLDESQKEKTKMALLARQDDWTGRPYADIRAKVVMMMRLDVPESLQLREARRWVQAGGTRLQIPQADLKYDIVRNMFSDHKVITSSFSVDWYGLLNPAQSGDYRFSISPININSAYKQIPFTFTMKVSIGGHVVLDSTPGASKDQSAWPDAREWISQSGFVNLTAGHPVLLQVTASVDAPQQLPSGMLHAMLYWEGPRFSQSLVPADNLTTITGQPGLAATYSWKINGAKQILRRVDASIDFAWTNSSILLSENTSEANQAAEAMWRTMTAPEFLTMLSGPPMQLHPFLKDADDASSGLSTRKRQEFCDLLLQNPGLLDVVDAKLIVRFYEAFRIGNTDKALKVFGIWAARHADLPCEISNDRVFDGDTRFALATMAIHTTQQLPDHATTLQSQYLRLPNGHCVLPVAYTLMYSHLGRGKLADWIAFLDSKLDDPGLNGDARVNWLLAKAQAHEHRQSSARHYPFRFPMPASQPLDSRGDLDDAFEAAKSPQSKVRVAGEILGRLTYSGQYQAAKDFLSTIADSQPAAQKAVVTAWHQQVDGFVTDFQHSLKNRPIVAKQAYLNTLKARRDKAADNKDMAAVRRYEGLIKSTAARP
jgi:hypothetical protein